MTGFPDHVLVEKGDDAVCRRLEPIYFDKQIADVWRLLHIGRHDGANGADIRDDIREQESQVRSLVSAIGRL